MNITIDKVLDVGNDVLLVSGVRDDLATIYREAIQSHSSDGKAVLDTLSAGFVLPSYQVRVKKSDILGDTAGPFSNSAERVAFLISLVKTRLEQQFPAIVTPVDVTAIVLGT